MSRTRSCIFSQARARIMPGDWRSLAPLIIRWVAGNSVSKSKEASASAEPSPSSSVLQTRARTSRGTRLNFASAAQPRFAKSVSLIVYLFGFEGKNLFIAVTYNDNNWEERELEEQVRSTKELFKFGTLFAVCAKKMP